jgi:crotonobetaine/carnitine-CoA ligase
MDVKTLQNELDEMGLLVRKLEEWARTQPGKTFFYYGEEDRAYTYRAFNQLANNLAKHFKDRGVQKGDRVSLFLHNPLVTILVMFSLWKVGAVFCPINFLYKGRLLSYQLKDTGPKLLITEKGREPILNQIQEEIGHIPVIIHRPAEADHDFKTENDSLTLDPRFSFSFLDELLDGNHPDPDTELNYWDTANIIYTSGTTGPPKGVVQSFRWLQNYCFYGVKLLHPDDIVYCDLPLYHVGGAFSLVGRAAWRGCTVAVWDRFSASEFWNRIQKSRASYALLLDVMMPWLLQAPAKKDDRHNSLRRVHMQPLPEYHYLFAERFGIDFVNVGYGATEIGYGCAALIDETAKGNGTPEEFRRGFSKEEILAVAARLDMPVIPGHKTIKKGFMGRPCRFHDVSIGGEHDEELGPGEYGQILLRNRVPYVLLNEYFNRPEATAAVLGNLWFHSGDGAYRDEEGFFYFVDRMGGFIRVKGENISSFQIEDTLNTHLKIAVSAALPVKAEKGLEDDILVYIVTAPGEDLSEDELRLWMEKEMPKYMRPRHIRFIEALPQTPTHKVEKYKLKEMFLAERKE